MSLPSLEGWHWSVCHINQMQYLQLFFSAVQLPPVSLLDTHYLEHGLSGVTTTRRLATFSKSFYGLPIGSFPTFKGSFISLAKTPLKCLHSCLLTFHFKCHFKPLMVRSHTGIPGNKHADSLPKTESFLATAMVLCSSPKLLPKLVIPSVTNKDVIFPHSPSHLNRVIITVSLLELFFSRPICLELSAFASKVKASYGCHKSVVRKTLLAAPLDTFYRTLIIFFLTALPLIFYPNLFLALQIAPWRVALLLGLYEVPLFLHPSEGVGWHHHLIKPLPK